MRKLRINTRKVPKYKGVPIFRCVLSSLIEYSMSRTVHRHNMEQQEDIREALYYAYCLGKRISRVSRKSPTLIKSIDNPLNLR